MDLYLEWHPKQETLYAERQVSISYFGVMFFRNKYDGYTIKLSLEQRTVNRKKD